MHIVIILEEDGVLYEYRMPHKEGDRAAKEESEVRCVFVGTAKGFDRFKKKGFKDAKDNGEASPELIERIKESFSHS